MFFSYHFAFIYSIVLIIDRNIPLCNIEQYEKAIELSKKGLIGNPDQLAVYLTLAASYMSLNRTEEAHKAVDEILRLNPNFSLEYYAAILPYKRQETTDKFVEALRKAGLPE